MLINGLNLSALDLKIIYELDKNIRAPYSEIGKRVHLSKQAVKKRIEHLISRGVISHFVTIINMAKLRIVPCQVYLSLRSSSEAEEQELIAYLVDHPNVQQVTSCEGAYDIFVGAPQGEMDQILSELYDRFSDRIKSKKIIPFIDTRLFTREYLLDKERKRIPLDRGFHSPEDMALKEITKLDYEILFRLTRNPRSSYIDIAKELNVSVQTVINHVKSLEKNGIIVGYFLLLNPTIFITYNLLLELSSLSKELEKKLFQYFAFHPNVVFVVKALGEYDFTLIVECKDFNEYRNFSKEFKRLFAPHIKSFIPLLMQHYHKLNFNSPTYAAKLK